jgi:hypothetical protein
MGDFLRALRLQTVAGARVIWKLPSMSGVDAVSVNTCIWPPCGPGFFMAWPIYSKGEWHKKNVAFLWLSPKSHRVTFSTPYCSNQEGLFRFRRREQRFHYTKAMSEQAGVGPLRAAWTESSIHVFSLSLNARPE